MDKIDKQLHDAKDFKGYLQYLKDKNARSDRLGWYLLSFEIGAIVVGLLVAWTFTIANNAVATPTEAACSALNMEPVGGTQYSTANYCMDANNGLHRLVVVNHRAFVSKEAV